jgi:hypothetical protein
LATLSRLLALLRRQVLGKAAAQLATRLEKKRKQADREVDESSLPADKPPPPVSDKALRALRAAVEKVGLGWGGGGVADESVEACKAGVGKINEESQS